MRVLDISDGFSSASAPSQGSLEASGFAQFADTAAYVTSKGVAATDGDCFYNTTSDVIQIYADGSWSDVVDADTVQDIVNKSFVDASTTFEDDGDGTKKMKMQLSSITTATTRTVTYPDADITLIGAASTETLTNKTLTDPVLDASSVYDHITTPSNPAAGKMKTYAKSDNKLYTLSPAGTELEVITGYRNYSNYIINGNIDIAERGTSFATVADATQTLDRFQYIKTGVMVHTVSQDSTDVPTQSESGYTSENSLKIDCTTLDASIAAGDFSCIMNTIEGNDAVGLYGNTFTLSFWVKGTKTGIHCVSFRNGDKDRSYVAEYTIDSTATWEKKTITVTHDTTGTWDVDESGGIRIAWALAGGSTFQTTADTWAAGDFLTTANQVNACDSASNDFNLAQIMVNEGSVALPFKRAGANIQDELAMCQRYYYVTGSSYQASMIGFGVDGTTFGATAANINGHGFPMTMRDTPTVTIIHQDGTEGAVYKIQDGSKITGVAAQHITNKGFLYVNKAAGFLKSYGYYFQYSADAEIV